MDGIAAGMAQQLADFTEHHSRSFLATGTGRITDTAEYDEYSLLHAWNYPVHRVAEFFRCERCIPYHRTDIQCLLAPAGTHA